MRYEDLRSVEFPQYLLNSNLKTCVYCNAQSTITIEPIYYNSKKKKKRKKIISKLQLDHFYPKSKYRCKDLNKGRQRNVKLNMKDSLYKKHQPKIE